MKKLSLFILILCCFVFIPGVNAEPDTENSTTTTTTTIPVVTTTTTTTQAAIDDTTTTTKKIVVKNTAKKTTTTAKKTTTTTTTTAKLEDKVVVLSENELKAELSKSTILVEAAEKSLMQEDYDDALSSVNKLNDSIEKTNLLKRLEEVKLNIAVKENCPVSEEKECKECKECNNVPWIILSVGLFICLAAENIYLVYRNSKMYD